MKRWLLTLFCLIAASAVGATPLESLRAQAASARSVLNQTRGAQLKDQAELNALGTRIEKLKSQAKGKLLPGSELDEALKRSQELSGELTSLAGTLSSKETELESANLALLSELSGSLASLRAQFDRQTDREARRQLIAKMRDLRHERETVRAMLPQAKLPALDGLRDSDDPEDLLEQADLLKDNEDKVRNQLKTLEKRIAEAKEERDLDSRVRQFMGDDALFDEQDRRVRVHRESVEAAAATPTTRVTAGPDSSAKGADSLTPGQQPANPSTTGGFSGNPNAPPPAVPGAAPQVHTTNASDARPVVGGQRVAGHGDDDDLEDLEIQRAKLKGLAEELKARADSLQKKAAQLK